ncbi:MAG: FAD binding domain-containing protein [Chloroflexi bacterium]|nr:FAD binding domain-containing protein [Chloroflexota bacterium]MDA8188863.1 xanthine dehydrogenase family protein subunit M [Dehalococcoidales bacterium]
MRLPKFECFYPKTVDEACAFLAEHKDQTRIIAGGTDLVVALKQRRTLPQHLLNLKSIPDLSLISYDQKTGLSIGALATLDDVARNPEIKKLYPSLSQAASRVAAPQIRNKGTIGGNVALDSRCWYYNQSEFWRSTRPACFKAGGDCCYVVKGGKQCYSLISADTVPALITLDASVELVSKAGSRVVAVEKLYTGIGQTPNVIKADEILTRVLVPASSLKGVYIKHAYRGAIDFPLIGVAVSLSLNGGNTVEDVRIAIGAATPAPVRAVKAEAVLKGKALSDELLAEAGQVATKEVTPIVHIFAPVAYKRKMVEVLLKRAVGAANREQGIGSRE